MDVPSFELNEDRTGVARENCEVKVNFVCFRGRGWRTIMPSLRSSRRFLSADAGVCGVEGVKVVASRSCSLTEVALIMISFSSCDKRSEEQ